MIWFLKLVSQSHWALPEIRSLKEVQSKVAHDKYMVESKE